MKKETNTLVLDKQELIKKYLMAAINLYGVIKLDDFIAVFNHYEEDTLMKEDEQLVITTIRSLGEDLLSIRNRLISNGLFLLSNDNDYKEAKALLGIQGDKPRYLPSKEAFLKFEDDDYVEPMDSLLELEMFIKKNKLVALNDLEEIHFDVLQLHDQIVFGGDTAEYFDYINRRGYQFEGEIQIKQFVDLMMKVMNHTRLYENNGFTPIEMNKYEELTIKSKSTH